MRINVLSILIFFAALPALAHEKSWSINWNSKYQSSLHRNDDAFKRSSVISTLAVNLAPYSRFRFQGVGGGIQTLQPTTNFRMINPEFRGFYRLNSQTGEANLYLGPTFALPFGTDAKEESLIAGIGAGARVVLNFVKAGGSGFRFLYDLTYNRNFHQYETSVLGEMNNLISLNHLVNAEYNFNSYWSLNVSGSFSSFWTYKKNLSNNYSIEQELDYQMNPWIMLYLAHVRGGDFLAPNGQNTSFGIFDRDASRVALGLVVSL